MNLPNESNGAEAAAQTGGVSITQVVFLLGTFCGMGLMLLILEFTGPEEEQDIEHYKEVRDLVINTFVGAVDEDELLENALRGMLNGLDDHSNYYVSDEIAAINRDTSGQTIGIGVIMRYQDGPRILFPLADSPAQEAGLRVGDEILSIDEELVSDMESEALSQLIEGEPGTTVRIRVLGLDQIEREHDVIRREMPIPSVRRVRFLDHDRRIGYIALTTFSNRSTSEFDDAVDHLKAGGMQALILDLRGNQGGVLSSAVEISQRFVREGVLTSTRGRGEPHIESADPELAWYYDLPLVLLVDGNSASASEVLAGALQDHRVAVLLGAPTYGKGVVQTISRYPERRAIAKVTTSYYYTPAHRNLQRGTAGHEYGLLPDFHVANSREERSAIYLYVHGTFEPPLEALPALRGWEQESGQELIMASPVDAQLEAAIAVFAGEFSG